MTEKIVLVAIAITISTVMTTLGIAMERTIASTVPSSVSARSVTPALSSRFEAIHVPAAVVSKINTVGVRRASGLVSHADGVSAATHAVDLAQEASHLGTFGVGGVLLGPDGRVLSTVVNSVIKDGKLFDPTGHAERQLVDDYAARVAAGERLPAPNDVTVVSSLEPCLMCTGSILTAGFKVLSVARDGFAGTTFKNLLSFDGLPKELRGLAEDSFGFFGVEGQARAMGVHRLLGKPLPQALVNRSQSVFGETLDAVKEVVNAAEGAPRSWRDPSSSAPIRALFEELDPRAFRVKTDPHNPGRLVVDELLYAAKRSAQDGNAFDAMGLIDPHGNLLFVTGGAEGRSPIRTPFLDLTRGYARVRGAAGAEAVDMLPPFKELTLVSLFGPGRSTTDVLNLGAYGSSVEGAMPARLSAQWQFMIPRQSALQLTEMLDGLPPLYSDVIGVRPQQVTSPQVVDYAHRRVHAMLPHAD